MENINSNMNQNESRIRYLENMLKTATIVSDKSSSDEVGMDDIVEVYFEEDDEIEKYKLVTSIRGNSMENINSNNAIVHSMNRNPIISFSPVGLLPSASQSQHLHDQRDRYDWTCGADAIPGGVAYLSQYSCGLYKRSGDCRSIY